MNFEFIKTGETNQSNLQMIDTQMPKFIGDMLALCLLSINQTTNLSLKDVAQAYSQTEKFKQTGLHLRHLEFKLKQFLLAGALGITASIEWTGKYKANGGFIIVKDTGELGVYHLINLNEFQEYLYQHTQFNRSSGIDWLVH